MKVQELLDSKKKWIKGAFARDKDGEPISPDSLDAVKWCLTGAIRKCYPLEKTKIINKIEDTTGINIITFNDSHSYKEVMELVRRLDI